MKAIVYNSYGPPDVLQLADIEQPVPQDHEVLIKVSAASVNPLDWHFMRGTPYLVRLFTGLRKPKTGRLGADVAGEVEAVGKSVTRFKPGDAVCGSCRGAFAEYVCASESALIIKPGNITFEQAAAVPIAALTALQGLCDHGRIKEGQHVLINGAAGGVGTFAVQIAKSFGAKVTAVCSAGNIDMVRLIGADHVIDYTREDFSKGNQCYNIIFDTVGNHSLSSLKRVLKPRGIHVGAGGQADVWMIRTLSHAFKAFLVSIFGSRKFVGFLAKVNQDDLTILQGLVSSGKVTPIIDRCYKLIEVPEAVEYLEKGHAKGKVVITLE